MNRSILSLLSLLLSLRSLLLLSLLQDWDLDSDRTLLQILLQLQD